MCLTQKDVFFELLSFSICEKPFDENAKNLITDEMLLWLFNLSKRQDVAHLIGYALDKNGLLESNSKAKNAFFNEQAKAVFKVEQLKFEFNNIFNLLNENEIVFLPLKGTVIRQYYPQEWMRTSADIDILIHKEDLSQTISLLEQKLGYKKDSDGAYDVVLIAPSGVHVELHFDLIAKYDNQTAHKKLNNVWEFCQLIDGKLSMRDDYFYYYHIAHMARHVFNGGCGVRPFIDLWILRSNDNAVIQDRELLLKEGNLNHFAKACEKLVAVWFKQDEHSKESALFEKFILDGDVYGNLKNKLEIRRAKSGGKFKYVFSRIFMPMEQMQHRYNCLKKHKWLYPFMVVRRCFEALFTKNISKEIKQNNSVSNEKQRENEILINYLGL